MNSWNWHEHQLHSHSWFWNFSTLPCWMQCIESSCIFWFGQLGWVLVMFHGRSHVLKLSAKVRQDTKCLWLSSLLPSNQYNLLLAIFNSCWCNFPFFPQLAWFQICSQVPWSFALHDFADLQSQKGMRPMPTMSSRSGQHVFNWGQTSMSHREMMETSWTCFSLNVMTEGGQWLWMMSHAISR